MSVRIAQISDLHASPDKPFFNANMMVLMEHVRASRPDLLFNTGDLGLYGEQDNGDLALAMAAHRDLGCDCHFVPGNHDVGEHPEFSNRVIVDETSLARYRRTVGVDCWVLDLPGWRFIGINALIVGSGLSGDAEQFEMLAKASTERAGRALAIVLHKPMTDLHYADMHANNRFMTHGPRQQILAALRGGPADLFLNGHVHQYRDGMIGGSRHLWAPAASFLIGDPWQPTYGGKCMGYLEHIFHADGTHQHRLVTVRDLVHNDLATMPEVYGDVTRHGPGNG